MLRLALEERVKHLDKAVHQAHDWLCSNPLPSDSILWAQPPDPLNPFSVSHMPPQTRPAYQHPPPLPKNALKKPSKPASGKAQPATRRAPKNSKRPCSRASAPRPPPTRPFPALLSTHAHGNHKNAIDHHKPIRPQSIGRPQSAPRPLPLTHPHTPRHATVKHAYLSPLGPPLLGAQVRLPLPPPPVQCLPGHPKFFPPIQGLSVPSSRLLQPSAPS